MSLRTFLGSILLCFVFPVIVCPQVKPNRPADTGLVLEIALVKSSPPIYAPVYWPDSPNPGNWYLRFDRPAGWQPRPGTKRTFGIRLLPHLTSDSVRVRVAVLRGQEEIEAEEVVGTYTLRVNEKFKVEEAKEFGVQPFEIKVLRVSPLPSNLPVIENGFSSVDVVGIEPIVSALPVYKLTFRNPSGKSIDALYLQVMRGEKSMAGFIPQGSEGRPLMAAGETIEWSPLPLHTQAEGAPGNYVPSVVSEQRVVVTGLIFSDGTVEGKPPRDLFLAMKVGRKIELRRIVQLLERALTEAGARPPDGPAKLRVQVEGLGFNLTDSEQAELEETFTEKASALTSINTARRAIRMHVLNDLRISSLKGLPFETWLVRAKEHYSNWLVRLEAHTALRK